MKIAPVLFLDESVNPDLKHVLPNKVTIEIPRDHFAPGLWAGTEGALFFLFGMMYQIDRVDLDTGKLYVSQHIMGG